MKATSFAAALACAYAATSALCSPLSFDFSKRAESDQAIVERCVLTDANAFTAEHFTHLVVGGGTAGLALAVRLSEVASNNVGVIEAGPSGLGDSINDIPGQFGANLGTKYDWNYT